MKKLWLLPVFAGGILIGWIGRGNGAPQTKVDISQNRATTSARHQPRTTEKSDHEAKWATFGKRAKHLNFKEKETVLKELAPEDRMSAVEALASQAGLNGLSYEAKSMMEEILGKWADEDFDHAWAASRNAKDPELRAFMMEALLNQLAKKDEDRAFALHLEQVAIDPEFDSGVPRKILATKLQLGAAEYLEALGKTKFGDGSSGSWATFAENFDFQLAAGGVAKLMKDRKSPANFPTNFYTEWAKKDPEAVFAWWSANISPPFNDLNNIIQAIDSQKPGSSAPWLAAKLQDPGAARTKIIDGLASRADNEMAARMNAVAAYLPDAAAADAFLTAIVTADAFGNGSDRYTPIIAALSSPQARLATFQILKDKNRTLNLEKISDAQLQQWQLSRSQLEQIFVK